MQFNDTPSYTVLILLQYTWFFWGFFVTLLQLETIPL